MLLMPLCRTHASRTPHASRTACRADVLLPTVQMYSIILLHEVQLGLGAVAKLSGGVTQGGLGGL